jgi:hypothetical protein
VMFSPCMCTESCQMRLPVEQPLPFQTCLPPRGCWISGVTTPRNSPLPSPIRLRAVSFSSHSASQKAYDAEWGYSDMTECDTTMYAQFELANSEKRYACSPMTLDMTGLQTIECEREVGSMGTNVKCKCTVTLGLASIPLLMFRAGGERP